MKLASGTAGKGSTVRAEQVILFRIGTQLFAISSAAVQEIRSIDSLAGATTEITQPELRKVRHALRRGERALYVVHGGTMFGLPLSRATLVFLLRRGRAALLVDSIEKMAAITRLQALPGAFCHEERSWYRGLAVLEDGVIPVLDPEGLLDQQELALLDATIAAVGTEGGAKYRETSTRA